MFVNSKIHISIIAQPSVSLSIRPKKNVKIIKWSLTPEIPQPVNWNNDTTYFAFISHGSNAPPLNITINFKVPFNETFNLNFFSYILFVYFFF